MHAFYSQTIEKPNKSVLQSYFFFPGSINRFLVQYLFSASHEREIVESHLSDTEGTKIKSGTPKKVSWTATEVQDEYYFDLFILLCNRKKNQALTIVTKTLYQLDQSGRNAFPSSTGQKALPKNTRLDYLAVALPCHLPYEGHALCGFETLKSFSEILRNWFWRSEIPGSFPDSYSQPVPEVPVPLRLVYRPTHTPARPPSTILAPPSSRRGDFQIPGERQRVSPPAPSLPPPPAPWGDSLLPVRRRTAPSRSSQHTGPDCRTAGTASHGFRRRLPAAVGSAHQRLGPPGARGLRSALHGREGGRGERRCSAGGRSGFQPGPARRQSPALRWAEGRGSPSGATYPAGIPPRLRTGGPGDRGASVTTSRNGRSATSGGGAGEGENSPGCGAWRAAGRSEPNRTGVSTAPTPAVSVRERWGLSPQPGALSRHLLPGTAASPPHPVACPCDGGGGDPFPAGRGEPAPRCRQRSRASKDWTTAHLRVERALMPDLGGSARYALQFGSLRLLRYRLLGVFAVTGSESLECGVLVFIPFGVFSYFIGKEVANTSQALQATSHGVYFVC